jgi:uncharacterized membrane protein
MSWLPTAVAATCCTHTCAQGRDCPIRTQRLARVSMAGAHSNIELGGGNFWLGSDGKTIAQRLTTTTTSTADPIDPLGTATFLEALEFAKTVATILAIVACVGVTAGYMWQRWGGTVLDIINRHAATLRLPG